MHKRFGLLVLAAFLALPLMGCRNNRDSQVRDEVIRVTLNHEEASVVRGGTLQFVADVEVRGDASRDVDWSIQGNTNLVDTFIEDGLLAVALNEGANTLTVTARSAFDPRRYATATVTLTNPEPGQVTITVTIDPQTTSVVAGGSVPFTVTVNVTGQPADVLAVSSAVTWDVAGNEIPSTAVGSLSPDTYSATLFVAGNETAETLTVTATSAHDPTRSASATVTVSEAEPVTAVWLVGHMAETGWNHPGEPMTGQAGGIFTWEGYVEEIAGGSHFRFNLSDATTSWNNGSWFAPEVNSTDIEPGYNDMRRFDNPANPYRAWTIAPGWYRFTLDSVAATLYVERPVTVDSVTITTSLAEVITGRYYDFDATLEGRNADGATVVWTVEGGTAGTGFGINGTAANRLTIAAGETVGANLTVRASAGGQTDTVTVPVADSAGFGDARVVLRIEDMGTGLAITGGMPTTPVVVSRAGNGNPTSVTFEATHPEADSFEWIVSGVRRYGDSITINAGEHALGHHTVRLVVIIDGVPWSMSQELHFTVER